MDRGMKNAHMAWMSEAQWLTLQLPLRRHLQALGLRQVELRPFVEAVLCKVAEGAGWRQLPESFGKWNTIYRRYVRWQRHDLWRLVLDSLGPESGFTYSSEERAIHYRGRNGLIPSLSDQHP
jgi:transposase